jgi:hypothetical protein
MDSRFDHLEPNSQEEARLLAGLLQEAQDWGDLLGDLEAGDRVQAAFRTRELVAELEKAGFWVFGGRRFVV